MNLNNQTKSISHITQRNSEPGTVFPKGTNLILGSLLFLVTKGAALQSGPSLLCYPSVRCWD